VRQTRHKSADIVARYKREAALLEDNAAAGVAAAEV
jgi:hypothetical protein